MQSVWTFLKRMHISFCQIYLKCLKFKSGIYLKFSTRKEQELCVTYDGEADWSAYQMGKKFSLMAQIAEEEKVQGSEVNESKYPQLPPDVKDKV